MEGDALSETNIWVKRPGTGEIKAENYKNILGKKAKTAIMKNEQIKWSCLE
jgi:sialic acid synthase SpsE